MSASPTKFPVSTGKPMVSASCALGHSFFPVLSFSFLGSGLAFFAELVFSVAIFFRVAAAFFAAGYAQERIAGPPQRLGARK